MVLAASYYNVMNTKILFGGLMNNCWASAIRYGKDGTAQKKFDSILTS